jgi:hypothetical protein
VSGDLIRNVIRNFPHHHVTKQANITQGQERETQAAEVARALV